MLELGQKKFRKGTKSCVECRQRKIKCEFSEHSQGTCKPCATRQQRCTPQLYRDKSKPTTRRTTDSYDRIARLEQQVARLVDGTSEPVGTDDVFPESSLASPPTHLRLLFENASTDGSLLLKQQATAHNPRFANIRARLQRLVPAREDVHIIARSAEPWLQVYHKLFPTASPILSSTDLIDKYEKVMSDDAHPLALAAFLVAMAMTVVQYTNAAAAPDARWETLEHPSAFVRAVVDALQTTVFDDDSLASTTDGIKTMLLYSRLLLVRGDVRGTFTAVRRVIAMAEFTGLQRAPYTQQQSTGDEDDNDRSALFDTICSTDRMISMMFNLPSATKAYKLPPKPLIDNTGEVSVAAYMSELASIAMNVQDIDEELAQKTSFEKVYDKILLADSRMRALAHKPGQAWWMDPEQRLEPRHFAQYLHSYLMVRIHLHASIRSDPGKEYEYSRTAGIDACQQTIRRYLVLRRLLIEGFPFIRMIHIQIFTTSIILLLSQQSGSHTQAALRDRKALVEEAVTWLERDVAPTGFTVEAAAALRSLQAWFDVSSSPERLTLRVPMLGRVTIGKQHRGDVGVSAMDPAPTASSTINSTSWSNTDDSFVDQDPVSWMLELDMGAVYNDSLFSMDDFVV
ncbi:hypothetical protein AMS68_002129 [Peltaster fructicola]|uniref:Zn(2)-C6 fungal-type domain-containing protein n=1 Tax=Peltaster fructicola TaxID=286661 RepID=A0A6H0XPC2_9PEZI|nr:hypothetical protein AMS68_002129 [Peltaster fructicola]